MTSELEKFGDKTPLSRFARNPVPTPKIWTHKDWRWKNGSKSLSFGVEGTCFERV